VECVIGFEAKNTHQAAGFWANGWEQTFVRRGKIVQGAAFFTLRPLIENQAA